MRRLRDRLKERDYKLYESLMRSHDIAWNEWLPALSVHKDSYNSFPHIRNLETYLDTIVNSYEESKMREFFVSDIEIYIILAAILFHDIGRINQKEGRPDNHPSESSLIICGKSILFPNEDKVKKEDNGKNEKKDINSEKNYKVWASLGIPSYDLALSIGRICEYHDVDKKKNEDEKKALRNNLASIYIDAYGEVRQKALAALLTLVDHLDSTHTRIMPDYLRGAGEIKVVGAFRRVITGVYIDLKTQMVRTVLNETLPDGEEAKVRYKLNHGCKNDGSLKELGDFFKDDLKEAIKKDIEDLIIDRDRKSIIKFIYNSNDKFEDYKKNSKVISRDFLKLFDKINYCVSSIPKREKKEKGTINEIRGDANVKTYEYIKDFFNGSEKECEPDLIDILVINGILFAEIDQEKNRDSENRTWPQSVIQDLILSNIYANTEALSLIKSDLESLEIPISAWLIDHREHLYNCYGQETFEPIFSKRYLCEVASRMWEISTQIFGISYFSYENLAAMMREPDVQKVKMAVRRLSIITSSNIGENGENAIMSSDTNWKWMVDNSDKECNYLDIRDVERKINSIGEPNGK